jgi:hypothetical protein
MMRSPELPPARGGVAAASADGVVGVATGFVFRDQLLMISDYQLFLPSLKLFIDHSQLNITETRSLRLPVLTSFPV